MKTIELDFKGYFLEEEIEKIPIYSGIYCVYAAKYSPKEYKYYIEELLYIGKATNLQDRLSHHDKKEKFEETLYEDEKLGYSYARVHGEDKNRAEAALINEHTPPFNKDFSENFPFNDVKIICKGNNIGLKKIFTPR